MTGTCLNLAFSNKLLIDSWCGILIVNHITDHGFEYFFWDP